MEGVPIVYACLSRHRGSFFPLRLGGFCVVVCLGSGLRLLLLCCFLRSETHIWLGAGSVKSVHSFLRLSHSIWAVLTTIFMVITTNYFDDFISLAIVAESQSVDFTVKTVFRMLGWKFAEDGPKAPPLSPAVTALGVSVDVSDLHQGLVLIDNTEKRALELLDTISSVIQFCRMTKKEALRLRGRMQFVSGQIFGRVAKRCLSAVTQHAYDTGDGRLSDVLLTSLERFCGLLQMKVPRTLTKKSTMTWFIFTDASHESGGDSSVAGVGAVLVNSLGEKVNFFSERLDDDLLTKINVSKRKTIIFECEFFAFFCAMWLWKEMLAGSTNVIHTDSDGVRDAFISCHTTSDNALPILNACLQLEFEQSWNVWIARVPTESNIADEPSRFDVSFLLQCGCARTFFDPCSIWVEWEMGRHHDLNCQPHMVKKMYADLLASEGRHSEA